MTRPSKLSAKIFLELPPVLSRYIDSDRNSWLDSNPAKGRLVLMGRPGVFCDLEAAGIERKQLVETLGQGRARALCFRIGFEQGRRDAIRHSEQFGQNARLALQAAPTFGQLQGRYTFESQRFEYDLDAGVLYGDLLLRSNSEAEAHRLASTGSQGCGCWTTAGYLSGHISEIVEANVLAIETDCLASGGPICRFICRLDSEWGPEADWMREAFLMESVDSEVSRRDQLVSLAQTAARKAQRSLIEASRKIQTQTASEPIVAESPEMSGVMKRARVLSESDVPILLIGEPGSGRRSIAKAIHAASVRNAGPFIEIDSVSLPGKLFEQELYGFIKGAFTGASADYKGVLTRARHGTVFITETCSLSPEQQRLLARVLDENSFTPLGGAKSVKLECRIVFATRHDLTESSANEKLNEELYYLINVGRVDVPSLRDHREDIPGLVHHFIKRFAERYEIPEPVLSDEVKRVLIDASWPGNVRQLRSVVEHAAAGALSGRVELANLPDDFLVGCKVQRAEPITSEVIRAVLKRTKGNRSRAAAILGIGRTTLWRAMKRAGPTT